MPASRATVRKMRRYPNIARNDPEAAPLCETANKCDWPDESPATALVAGEVVGVPGVVRRVVQPVGAGEADAVDEHGSEQGDDHGRGERRCTRIRLGLDLCNGASLRHVDSYPRLPALAHCKGTPEARVSLLGKVPDFQCRGKIWRRLRPRR